MASGKTAYALGLAAGTIQGATGISAQIVAPYYHARRLAPETYAFAVAFTFLFFALAQVAAMTNMELLTPARFQLSLLALIPTLIFTQLGIGGGTFLCWLRARQHIDHDLAALLRVRVLVGGQCAAEPATNKGKSRHRFPN